MAITGAVEQQQRAALRRMKLGAGGLLVLAAAVYAVTVHGHGWLGYVNTAAEAGMVGGLADWFAVTALFRRPLGLPIPHTAIIPNRKDALGRSLEHFVASNFLSEPVVRDKVRRSTPAARAGHWLGRPENAVRVTGELAAVARGAIAVLRDDDVQSVLEQTLLRRLAELPWGPPAGRLLGQVVVDGTHTRLVDVAISEAHDWLEMHREAVVRAVLEQAPAWSPKWVDERVAHRVHAELLRVAADVRDQPSHRVRLALDHYLLRLAKDLRDDPVTIERMEQAKQRLLEHPGVREATGALWATVKRLAIEAVDDPDSELRRRTSDGLAAFGRRLTTDDDVSAKVDRWVEDAVSHVVTTYRAEITGVISDTVNRWDADETARRVELQVGRDLQFIRVNGTVVGAIAGLLIHLVTVVA